jgi:CRP-like cAMP-binding protein
MSLDLSRDRLLEAGRRIDLGTAGLWRLRHGLVSVVRADASSDDVLWLASPGDLIGADRLAGDTQPLCVVAVTTALLSPVAADVDLPATTLLAQAYAQARRQARDLLRLRTGAVADRVKALLLLMGTHTGGGGDHVDMELPSLRRLADVLDTAPETVCRVLARLRDMQLLEPAAPGRLRLTLAELQALSPPPGMTACGRAKAAAAALC